MTRPEDLLSNALHDRAESRELPGTPMGQVVSTARRIQRRRRVRTGLVTAAVVAVLAVPFAVAVKQGSDGTTVPTDPSSTGSKPRIRLADVGLGEPPGIAWLDGRDYVAADGTRTTLPLDVTGATPYRGGFLVTVTGPDLGPRVVLLDSDLREVWRRCGQGAFAVSEDGNRTAYDTADCDSSVSTMRLDLSDEAPGGAADPLLRGQAEQVPVEQGIPVGIIGDTVVARSLPGARSLVVDFDGSPEPITTLGQAAGSSEGRRLVSGQLAGHPSTGAVIDADSGAVLWDRPGWALADFSPDGSRVLGTRTGRSGPVGSGVFDARTGELIHEFGQLADFESQQPVWEDDQHLLAVTTQGSAQAILRTTLDGAVERATETAPYDEDSLHLGLGLAPRP